MRNLIPSAHDNYCEHFSFFLGNIQAYLLSTESIAVQISVLNDNICPFLEDPAGCMKGTLPTYFNGFFLYNKQQTLANPQNMIYPMKQLLILLYIQNWHRLNLQIVCSTNELSWFFGVIIFLFLCMYLYILIV